ncbi:MAG: hypothetical protein LBT79_05650 [Elusimicrobiota bacterium]|jgi:hypothetical protein|nr:hypothetical protein [Elusimicrobiota bacterium]
MKQFDNVTSHVIDDLKTEIKQNGKISVAAACFSIYAYENLKEEFENIETLIDRKYKHSIYFSCLYAK